jgi:hypothetical protein
MGKNRKAVITVSTREATLKRRLRSHLKSLGFTKTEDGILMPPGSGKDNRTLLLRRKSKNLFYGIFSLLSVLLFPCSFPVPVSGQKPFTPVFMWDRCDQSPSAGQNSL